MNRKIGFDLVRIFAAWMVLNCHIGQTVGYDFGIGAQGVYLFFVLSGYLVFLSLDKNDDLKTYYKRRAVRILPAYWLCLLLLYVQDILFAIWDNNMGGLFSPGGQCGYKFLRYVFFIQCVLPSDDWNLWNNHNALWTMSAFAAFYVFAPFMHKAMKRLWVSVSVLVILLLSNSFLISYIKELLKGYPPKAHIEWYACMNPLTVLYCFMFGACLFIMERHEKNLLYGLLLLCILIISGFDWYSNTIVFTILILLASMVNFDIKKEWINKLIRLASDGSFALYLFHPLVLRVVPKLWFKIGFDVDSKVLYTIYVYLACISVSYFVYYFIIKKMEATFISEK